MTSRAVGFAVALVLVVVPAIGAQPPDGPPGPDCDLPVGEPAFDPDAEIETWDGDVPSDLDGGTLEVRSFLAGAYVVPWDRSAWQVEIGEVDPLDQLTPTVEARTDGGVFSLVAVVEPTVGAVQVGGVASSGPTAQVKVHVPSTVYEEVTVADRSDDGTTLTSGNVNGSDAAWDELRVVGLDSDDLDIRGTTVGTHVVDGTHDEVAAETDNSKLAIADVRASEAVLETDNGAACLTNLDVDEVTVRDDNGAVAVDGLKASDVDVVVDNGRVDLTRVNASRVDVTVDNGDVRIETARIDTVAVDGGNQDLVTRGLVVRDLTYRSDNGDLDADLFPATSGTWILRTDNGRIGLHLPVGDRFGYDANATVENGEPALDIPGTEVVSRGERHVHVRTVGYEERSVRTRIRIQGDNAQVAADDETTSTASGAVFPAGPETAAAAGAGALAAAGAAAYLLWPKLKVLVSPLYTRLSRDELLDNATRRRIVDAVRGEPGIHFRELMRRTDLGRGLLQHHVDKLVEAGLLAEQGGSTYRCYFPKGEVDRRVMAVADRLRADGARAVLDAVQRRPGASLTELADTAELSSSTAGYHLEKLAKAGLVTKARRGGSLAVDLTDLGSKALDELQLT